MDTPAPRHDLGLANCVQRQLFQQLEHAVAVVSRVGKLLFIEGRTELFFNLHTEALSAETPNLMNVLRYGMKEDLEKAIANAWATGAPVTIDSKVQRENAFQDCTIHIDHLRGRPKDQPALLLTFSPAVAYRNLTSNTSQADSTPTTHLLNRGTTVDDQTGLEINPKLATTRDQLNFLTVEPASQRPAYIKELRRILDHQLTSVMLLDRDGKTIEVNQTLLETTGYTREQLIGKPASELPLWKHDQATVSELQSHFDEARRGKPTRWDVTGSGANKQVIHFDFMLAPVYDENGTHVYMLASATDINARKAAEQQLAASEKRYRALVDATAEFVWTTNPSGEAEEDSPTWRDFTGQTTQQYLGSGWLDAIHPDDRAKSDKAWRQAVAKKASLTCEYRVRKHDGSYQCVSARGVPVLDEQGQVTFWVGLNVNIQPYRDLAAAAQETKDRLAMALIAADAGSWEATSDTIQFDVPQTAEQAHGVPARQPLPLHDGLAGIHPQDRDHVEQAIRKSLTDQAPFTAEYRLTQPGGTFRWILSKAQLQSDTTTPRLVGFFQDITERKQASLKSATNERRLAAALEGGKMGLWEWDAATNTSFWNNREYELLGLEPGDGHVPASLFTDHIHPDDQPEMERIFDEVLRDGSEFSHEVRVIRADGEIRWLAALGKLERDEHQKPLRCVGINFDITEQKEIAEALRESDQRKDQFLATLAHELRNPLAPLRSGLEILRTCGDNPAAIEQTLHTMERQLAHMVALVDDLLDVSRISRGKLTLRNQRVCVQKLIHEAIGICKPLIEAAHHLLSLQMPAEDLFVQGDPHRLSQVVSNVINNATKFTPPGGKIDVAVTKIDNQVEITVHDNGRGIARNRLDDVFTMFVQSDESATHGYSGLGIGLSLVKRLVEMHHGSVRLTSPGPDQGTTLTVCLPLADTPALTTNDPPPSTTTTATPQLKVLVVDDNQAAADSLSLLLKVWGHDVRTAANGKVGVELAAQYAPNLILMDTGMPIMDGNAAAKAIRSEPWGKHIYLVAVSGWGQAEDIQRTNEAGFDRHLVKPVDPKVLGQLINDLAPRDQPKAPNR